MTNERSDVDLDRVARLMQPVARPLGSTETAAFAALLEAWAAESLTPAALWAALRQCRSLAKVMVSAPAPAGGAAEWTAVLQPMPGLGSALAVRRAQPPAEIGFRVDGAGQPCGAIELHVAEEHTVLEIEPVDGGARLHSCLHGREQVIELGAVPAGHWTAHPALPPSAARTQAGPQLLVAFVSGPARFAERLVDRTLLVGRGEGCDVQILDRRVSRRHAEIEPHEGGFRLRDLGAGGGTFLNGRRLAGPERVTAGDRVRIGDTHLELRAGAGDTDATLVGEAETFVPGKSQTPPLTILMPNASPLPPDPSAPVERCRHCGRERVAGQAKCVRCDRPFAS